MVQIIASLLGYGLILRASAVVIGLVAGLFILRRHWPIKAEYHIVEEKQLEPPSPATTSLTNEETPPVQSDEGISFAEEMQSKLVQCRCGGTPEFHEGYDTLQVVCPRCGKATESSVALAM